jgi:hypothetical protein
MRGYRYHHNQEQHHNENVRFHLYFPPKVFLDNSMCDTRARFSSSIQKRIYDVTDQRAVHRRLPNNQSQLSAPHLLDWLDHRIGI